MNEKKIIISLDEYNGLLNYKEEVEKELSIKRVSVEQYCEKIEQEARKTIEEINNKKTIIEKQIKENDGVVFVEAKRFGYSFGENYHIKEGKYHIKLKEQLDNEIKIIKDKYLIELEKYKKLTFIEKLKNLI